MSHALVQPRDIAIGVADPFSGLEPGGPDTPWRSFSLCTPRLFCSRMFCTVDAHRSEAAALQLGAWLAEGGYQGLLLDYRGAVITPDPTASAALAAASAAAFPRGVLVGYISDAKSAPFTRLMTTLLRDRGVRAARAGDFETLFAAVAGRLNTPAE